MKRRSFRFRLALISMGLSGLVLLVFGLVAWAVLSRARVSSLDQELSNFGFRFASRSGPGVVVERQQETLESMVGTEVAPYRFFHILNRNGKPVSASPGWPRGLDPTRFPPSHEVMDSQPEFVVMSPKPGEVQPKRRLRPVYEPRFYTVNHDGLRYRIGVFRNADVVLASGADLDQFSQDVIQLRKAFLIALPAALAVIAFGAWWLGRKALRPIRVLEEDMRSLSVRDLNQRLEAGNADVEFARIIEVYNSMLERLERSFHQANRFSADVSHELKTPLAIMRGTLERGLSSSGTEEEAQEVFSDLLEQTGRQGAILESLLLLARADAGRLELSMETVELSSLLETWMEDASFLAEEKDIAIQSEIEPGIEMEGDAIMLQRVAHNLLSNAVRYNHSGGRIESCLRRVDQGVEWVIANTGETIAEVDHERLFERFERMPSSDSGAGLGLSLVKEIVVAHGGRVSIQNRDDEMTGFCVWFKTPPEK
ncbi:MAG: ATP-binding protein [Verrucomicrobiales bacterium]|nr:ATP-binding protein [Verrucomicrobiales bacterium]